MREEKLLNYLKTSCHGRENRKSGRELARTLGINVKDLQKLVKRLRKKKKSSTFHRFSLSETGWSCTTPMRSIGQSCAVSGTLYLFFACLYTPLICKHLSAIFPCYFCLSFSELLSISAERHKNSSHEHFSNS